MKTKEFIKRVNELGFEIIRAGSHIDIMLNDFIVAGVYTDQMHVMTFYSHEKLLLTNIEKLFDLLVEYAKTSVDKREDEKKFYLRHRYFQDDMGSKKCFCIRINGGYPLLKSIAIPIADKIKFTKKEIEEIKEKFNTDLADFEEVEVGDVRK